MKDTEICEIVDRLIANDIYSSGTYREDNQFIADRYNAELYGDEEEGLSSIVTTEVADTVDSDMVAYVRTFLSGNRPVEFKPVRDSPEAVKEAELKNLYVQWIIDNCEGSFRKQYDWLKEGSIIKMSWIEYGIKEEVVTEEEEFTGYTASEVEAKMDPIRKEKGVDSVEIEQTIEVMPDGSEVETFDFKVKVTRKKQVFFLQNIPWEDVICSKNVQCKHDAEVFGKRFRKRRGEVVSELMAKEEITKEKAIERVKNIPLCGPGESESTKDRRFAGQGGYDPVDNYNQWAIQEVEGVDVYALVDADDDGIAERRHIIKFGNDIVLENEPFDHIPYAGGSVIPMPHNIVGKSRGEISVAQQRISTVFSRHISDNASAVNQGRAFVDTKTVNMDDYFNSVKHGAIRVKGNPSNSVLPDPVLYHGDKTLQVISHFDALHAKRVGQVLTNQALTSDQLHKETATRFNGLEKAATGKIELAARVIAETWYSDLYQGIAWFAQKYQDTVQEDFVLGEQLNIKPSSWRFEMNTKAVVGTGFDDDDKRISALLALLDLMSREIESGTTLADNQKKYNVYKQLVRASGLHGVDQYFNDPSKPLETVFAQNQILEQAVKMLQMQLQQSQDSLTEAQRIDAQAKLLIAQSKKLEADQKDRIELAKLQQKDKVDMAKLKQEARQFAISTAQKDEFFRQELVKELTKLELESQKNVPGALV